MPRPSSETWLHLLKDSPLLPWKQETIDALSDSTEQFWKHICPMHRTCTEKGVLAVTSPKNSTTFTIAGRTQTASGPNVKTVVMSTIECTIQPTTNEIELPPETIRAVISKLL